MHDSQRGKKFGIRLIDQLRYLGTQVGCYKLLLTCSETNEPFYEKSGFQRKDLHMAQYVTQPQQQQELQVQQQPPQAQAAATLSAIVTTVESRASVMTESSCGLSSPKSLNSRGMPIEALSASMESIFVK